MNKTLFISDLHLDEKYPEITRSFLQLLKEIDTSTDALYILGDLFEAWIGDDDEHPYHQKIKHALRSVTQRQIPIYFIRGNRDFLIGKRFLQETGCQLLRDEEKMLLYGQPVLLMHGDTLCTRDISYLKIRKILRNPLLQRLFLLLPLRIRRVIAAKMREKSLQHTQSVAADSMDVTHAEVVRRMQAHQVCYLIHGHTHRPAIHHFSLDNKPCVRIVLPAWHDDQASMFVWNKMGQYEMVSLR